MRKIRSRIALVLTFMMLFSNMSAFSITDENTDSVKTDQNPKLGSSLETSDSTSESAIKVDEKIDDQIIYNLGNTEVIVGYNEISATEKPWEYKLFDEDGNYTINLEDNAFFPYEVQFKSNGEVSTVWFDTPSSTIEFKGHIFSVNSEHYDIEKFIQLGFEIGDKYIPVKPVPKTFTNDGNSIMKSRSLLPLDQQDYTVDLSGLNVVELADVKVNALYPVDAQNVQKVVWTGFDRNSYEILEPNDTIDLSNEDQYNWDNELDLEFILGSGLQLDSSNIFYNVTATMPSDLGIVEGVKIYNQENNIRTELTPLSMDIDYEHNYNPAQTNIYMEFLQEDVDSGVLYLSMDFDASFDESYEIKVYDGYYETLNEIENELTIDPNIDISNKLLSKTMDQIDEGLMLNALNETFDGYYEDVTVVVKKGGNSILQTVYLNISENYNYSVYWDALYTIDSTYNDIVDYDRNDWIEGVNVVKYTLDSGHSAFDTHYARLKYYYNGSQDDANRQYVEKAVVGHYDTIEETVDVIDIKDQLFPLDSSLAGSGYPANYSGPGVDFTIFLKDENVEKFTFKIEPTAYLSIGHDIYANDSTDNDIARWMHLDYENGIEIYTYTLYSGNKATDNNYLRLQYTYDGIENDANRQYVDKAVIGHYDSIEAAVGEKDIKDQLFPEKSGVAGSGYPANYSGNGQDITVFAQGEVYKYTFIAVESVLEPNPGSEDAYFHVTGANYGENDSLRDVYVLPYEHDTYYDVGYQTIFYIDNVETSVLKPTYRKDAYEIYARNTTTGAGIIQESGITQQDFSKGPIQYSASAENGLNLKNYWVTFVKQNTDGAKLFVNGINGVDGAKREVFLTSRHDNLHDIFIANIGNEELTGLNVILTGAQNIKLDPYWTFGGENNDTLAAFTETNPYVYSQKEGELYNVAKIRLLPDGEGEIKGTLTITADGQEPVGIELTGNAGNPRLLTSQIPEAVKYVPYAVQLMHNNRYPWNTVTLEIIDGELPDGVVLKPNGELYGVPTETGKFQIRVEMDNSYSGFADDSFWYTLTVNENTNKNVNNATDIGYELSQAIGTASNDGYVVSTIQDYELISEGEFDEFKGFWLNGERLVEGTDYTKDEGSTKITILSQTFRNKATNNGANTIAAEFRVDGDETNELKRTAQNFTIDINSSSGSSGSSSSSSSLSSNEEETIVAIENAEAGEVVSITMRNTVTVPVEILEAAQGKDVNLVFEFGDYSWTINGDDIADIPEGERRYNLRVRDIEAEGVDGLTNNTDILHLELTHEGEFPFEAILTYSVDPQYNGRTLYMYYLNPSTGVLDYISATVVSNGKATFVFDHASVYVITTEKIYGDEVVAITNPYTDVRETDWYYESVMLGYTKGIFDGTSANSFSPNMPASRAMFAMFIYRLENPTANVTLESNFIDVNENTEYAEAILWASETGIITGYGNGNFGPSDGIEREQAAVILDNYLKYKGIEQNSNHVNNLYDDDTNISTWAKNSVYSIQGHKLMIGSPNNMFLPQNPLTRSESAQIFLNYYNEFTGE